MDSRDETSPDPPLESESGSAASTNRDVTQALGVLVVVVGLSLVVLASFGIVSFEDTTARLLLGAGIILAAGREAIIAIVNRFAP